MAFDPKPITVEYVSPEEYDGAQDPQPFVVVGEAPGGDTEVAFSDITGTATASQIPSLSISKITNLQTTLTDLENRLAALESAGA